MFDKGSMFEIIEQREVLQRCENVLREELREKEEESCEDMTRQEKVEYMEKEGIKKAGK